MTAREEPDDVIRDAHTGAIGRVRRDAQSGGLVYRPPDIVIPKAEEEEEEEEKEATRRRGLSYRMVTTRQLLEFEMLIIDARRALEEAETILAKMRRGQR